MKRITARGFTLVELLIVIALLGVIATIVIAAINPIEQANRASDAGKKADASQIVSALQRYYASHNLYPWNASTCPSDGQCVATVELVFPFVSADDSGVGICGASGASCKSSATQGELLSSLELQNTFLNKSWIGAAATATQEKLWVGKAAGSSSSVFVCWSPKSNSNRQVLIASTATVNKLFNATAGFTSAGLPTAGSCTTVSDAGWSTGACVECVPE